MFQDSSDFPNLVLIFNLGIFLVRPKPDQSKLGTWKNL